MTRRPQAHAHRVAIVTGAAGGVGSATARVFARSGMRVAVLDLDQAAVDEIAREIGGGAVGYAVDLSDVAAYEAVIDEVEHELGAVDVLANVAAIMPVGPFEAEVDRSTERQLAVNLHAVIHSTKVMGARMRQRGRGHIINVASGAGWIPSGGGATYSATKAGVVGYSEAVALELAGSGVFISVIAPAVIKTEMSAGVKDVRGLRSIAPEEVAEAILAGLGHRRFAIFVPKTLGVMALGFSALPYGARHFLARAIKVDKLLLQADMRTRSAYEARAIGARPGREPAIELEASDDAAPAGDAAR